MILDLVSAWSLSRNSSPPWRRRRRRSYGSKSLIWFGKCNRSRQQVIEHLFSLSSFAPLLFFFFFIVIFIIFTTFSSLSSASSSSAFWLLLQVFLGWVSAKFRAFCRELRSALSDGFFLASANRLPYCCPLLSPHPWLLNFSDTTTTTTSVPAANKSSALPQCCYSFFPSKLSPSSSSSFLSLHWKLSFSIAIYRNLHHNSQNPYFF